MCSTQRRSFIAPVLVALVAVGCGTRVSGEGAKSTRGAPETSAPEGVGSPGFDPAAPSNVGESGQAEAQRQTTTGGTESASPQAAGAGRSEAPRPAQVAPASARPPSVSSDKGKVEPEGPSPASKGSGSGAVGGTAEPGPVPLKKSPIKVGNAGTYSGVGSSTFTAYLTGIQLWVKWVNSRGGVNGHPVQFIVADDGGDPAKHKAQVQELVERHGVLAFLNNVEPLTGGATVDYVTAKRIPVIGLDGGEPWAYDSPMYFPQAPSGQQLMNSLYGSWGQQALALGKKKFAAVACTEAQICREFYDQVEEQTKKRGLQMVYKGTASLAQPDFTAECLAARNAGAELLFFAGDATFSMRGAASCARQDFRPIFTTGGPIPTEDMMRDPNLDGHLISNATAFPYFQDAPSTAEFRAALARFGKGVQATFATSMSWVTGKLFEKAATQVSEPPTSQAILAGLWSIKDDDLGGLAQPLTFTQDQPASPRTCWWNVALAGGRWTSPDNYRRTCD